MSAAARLRALRVLACDSARTFPRPFAPASPRVLRALAFLSSSFHPRMPVCPRCISRDSARILSDPTPKCAASHERARGGVGGKRERAKGARKGGGKTGRAHRREARREGQRSYGFRQMIARGALNRSTSLHLRFSLEGGGEERGGRVRGAREGGRKSL